MTAQRKITWKPCPSVTTGGKPFFYVAKFNNDNYFVVWNRMLQLWALQRWDVTLKYFKSKEQAKKYCEQEIFKSDLTVKMD